MFYNLNNNLLYLIFYGYFYSIFHIHHKNWKIREYDTFSCDILDLNAIHMLKYRTRKKIDWEGEEKGYFLISAHSASHTP